MQIDMGLRHAAMHFVGGGGGSERSLELFAEANALHLKGRKPLLKKPSSRKSRSQPEAAHLQQLLYLVEASAGTMKVIRPHHLFFRFVKGSAFAGNLSLRSDCLRPMVVAPLSSCHTLLISGDPAQEM
jgi:hypothetical protein